MNNFIEQVFGPLDTRFCDYFFILSVLGFVFLFLLFVSAVSVIISSKRLPDGFFMQLINMALVYFILYFQNRLLFNMCKGSLN